MSAIELTSYEFPCQCQTMETQREGDELVFLYQLVQGHSDTSYACHTATTAGIPTKIVQRGAKVSSDTQCLCFLSSFIPVFKPYICIAQEKLKNTDPWCQSSL